MGGKEMQVGNAIYKDVSPDCIESFCEDCQKRTVVEFDRKCTPYSWISLCWTFSCFCFACCSIPCLMYATLHNEKLSRMRFKNQTKTCQRCGSNRMATEEDIHSYKVYLSQHDFLCCCPKYQ